MAKKRYISTTFWRDEYVSNLDPIEKLLFLYLPYIVIDAEKHYSIKELIPKSVDNKQIYDIEDI